MSGTRPTVFWLALIENTHLFHFRASITLHPSLLTVNAARGDGKASGWDAPQDVLRASNQIRPNGPGDSSPGLRPEADALGKQGPISRRPERSREPGWMGSNGKASSRGLTGRLGFVVPLLSQGIGLRPQPWAKISRPVGPVLRSPRSGRDSLASDVNRYRSSDIRARPLLSPAKRGQRGRPRPPPSPWQKGVSIVKEHYCPPRERIPES